MTIVVGVMAYNSISTMIESGNYELAYRKYVYILTM